MFDILDLDKNTLTNKKEYPQALKSYVEKINEIELNISNINTQFNNIVQNNVINLPIEDIKEKVNFINNTSFEKMEITSINDLNKLHYSYFHWINLVLLVVEADYYHNYYQQIDFDYLRDFVEFEDFGFVVNLQ